MLRSAELHTFLDVDMASVVLQTETEGCLTASIAAIDEGAAAVFWFDSDNLLVSIDLVGYRRLAPSNLVDDTVFWEPHGEVMKQAVLAALQQTSVPPSVTVARPRQAAPVILALVGADPASLREDSDSPRFLPIEWDDGTDGASLRFSVAAGTGRTRYLDAPQTEGLVGLVLDHVNRLRGIEFGRASQVIG